MQRAKPENEKEKPIQEWAGKDGLRLIFKLLISFLSLFIQAEKIHSQTLLNTG